MAVRKMDNLRVYGIRLASFFAPQRSLNMPSKLGVPLAKASEQL